jgi:hypothetical protein
LLNISVDSAPGAAGICVRHRLNVTENQTEGEL